MPIIIIAGHVRIAPEKRDDAVAAFAAMVERARAQDGCLDFAIGADPLDADRLNLFECWRDRASLDAWRKIAKGPRIKRLETRIGLYRSERAESPA